MQECIYFSANLSKPGTARNTRNYFSEIIVRRIENGRITRTICDK
jgi:hypothetical protein